MLKGVLTKGVPGPRRTRRALQEVKGLSGSYDILTIDSLVEFDGGKKTTTEIEGTFISARVSKLCGSDHNTTVRLKIDERTFVKLSFKKAQELGLAEDNNPYGIVLREGTDDLKTLIIGFSAPLFFREKLEIIVDVKETGVKKIEAVVIWGTELFLGSDEETGDDGNPEIDLP